MNGKPIVKNKISIIKHLSLVLIASGIGVTGWALINIQRQSVSLSNSYQSYYQSPTDIVIVPDKYAVVYDEYPMRGDIFGNLWIPVLEQNIAIVEGTGDEELKNGAGHFIDSVLPGVENNCVLSGHRETVFKNLGLLEIGDELIVETSAGIFIYKINQIRIVDKDDRRIIVPTDEATLTLTTCFPFNFVGSAPDRYILIADLMAIE